MRREGYVARVRKRRGVYRVLVGDLRERDYLKDPGVVAGIVIKIDLREVRWGVWTRLVWSV